MELSHEDIEALRSAKNLLENRGFAQKAASMLGMPVEKTLSMLPRKWQNAVNSATRKALHKTLDLAVFTMGEKQRAFLRKGPISTERFHKFLVAMAGACGGAFGLPALGVELPFSTLMILRSALVRFIREVSARFGILVSDKIVVQSLPMIGAAGGAGINALFIDHFQNIARGHFIVRRLERTYGEDRVKSEYDRLADC